MATATKTIRTLVASATTKSAGTSPTNDVNGTTWDLSTALGGLIEARITNGGTGPTVGCDFVVQVSPDGGTTWRDYSRQTAGTTLSTSYDFAVDIPASVKTARACFQNNTGQAVTCEAFGHELTSVG